MKRKNNMAKILVTGGAGYIGSHTIHHLIASGVKPEDIIVFDNLVYGRAEYLPAGTTVVVGDLLDRPLIARVMADYRIEAVMHFAAYASVSESMVNPSKYFINNISGGINLLDAMVRSGCSKIVFSSTCATYGNSEGLVSEDSLQQPINPYGLSKLYFEGILREYNKAYKINSVILRYFNAAGAGYGIGEGLDSKYRLIPCVLLALLSGEEISIFGSDYPTKDGTCIRDYISVVDLAAAHKASLEFLIAGFSGVEHFNLGTGTGATVLEIVNIAEEESGLRAKVKISPRRPGDPAQIIANPDKARRILGWKAEKNIRDIIHDAYMWHKAQSGKA